MRKVMWSIIAILLTFTFLAIGLNLNQQTVIDEFFREMSSGGILFPF